MYVWLRLGTLTAIQSFLLQVFALEKDQQDQIGIYLINYHNNTVMFEIEDWINGAVEVLLFKYSYTVSHTTQIHGLHHCLQWNKNPPFNKKPFWHVSDSTREKFTGLLMYILYLASSVDLNVNTYHDASFAFIHDFFIIHIKCWITEASK